MAKKVAFLQGNEAAAQGALYAGCTFFGGYPITPSTEVAEVMSMNCPKSAGNSFRWKTKSAPWPPLLAHPSPAPKSDLHLRSRSFPEAGADRLRLHRRNPLRHLLMSCVAVLQPECPPAPVSRTSCAPNGAPTVTTPLFALFRLPFRNF